MHVVSAGSKHALSLVFLHGWPEDWSAWTQMLHQASQQVHAVAIDLPGIGESVMADPPAAKHEISGLVGDVIAALGLKKVVVVGHDVGGQIAFAHLSRTSGRIDAAVIMDVVVPGLPPWDEVLRNPNIWHFAFHAVPRLPEQLVAGKEESYFDFFYNEIARHPERITPDRRRTYAKAYSRPASLKAGFNWYRAFPHDAACNAELMKRGAAITEPVLYIRGRDEAGTIDRYLEGFKGAGLANIRGAVIPDCGHFAPEEQPAAVWQEIQRFLRDNGLLARD